MARTLDVIGASGHAKVVIATAIAAGWTVRRVFDDNERLWGETLLGHQIRGPVNAITESPSDAAIIAIGANSARQRLVELLPLAWATIVHPASTVHSSVTLGRGTALFAGSVVQPDTRIGNHVIVNTSASIDHDCNIADFVHVGPGARLCGGVSVAEGALLGVGSCAIPGANIGSWSTVGAGAVVTQVVPENVTVVGAPAKRRTGS